LKNKRCNRRDDFRLPILARALRRFALLKIIHMSNSARRRAEPDADSRFDHIERNSSRTESFAEVGK
jgi:hypothetical protein